MKVYIKRNNIQVELIRFRKKIATLLMSETLKWEYTFATDVLIAIRDGSPLVCRAPDVSEHSHFGTCHIGKSTIRDCTTAIFQFTTYMQFAWKVGTSANSALIRYYLLRLKLFSSPRDREWTNRLVEEKNVKLLCQIKLVHNFNHCTFGEKKCFKNVSTSNSSWN